MYIKLNNEETNRKNVEKTELTQLSKILLSKRRYRKMMFRRCLTNIRCGKSLFVPFDSKHLVYLASYEVQLELCRLEFEFCKINYYLKPEPLKASTLLAARQPQKSKIGESCVLLEKA